MGTLKSGEVFPIVKNGDIRQVKVGPITVMEQNKSKPSAFDKKAQAGTKITWFISAGESAGSWGRIVDDIIEFHGSSINRPNHSIDAEDAKNLHSAIHAGKPAVTL